MNKDLLINIEQRYDSFSKGQKHIADFILKKYDKAAYITAAKLGSIVGVSESTVVRFATELGFDGYPSFQAALRDIIKTKLTAVQRMEIASDRTDEHHILEAVLQSDMDNLKKTLEDSDSTVFQNAVQAILKAKKIYILGVRSSAALATFLGFYFNLIFDNVVSVHTNSVSEMFEQLFRVGEDDVVIGISFPRYSNRTVTALKYAKDKKGTVISITDSNSSPLVPFSDYSLTAGNNMASFVDSLVAPLSVINALIFAVGIHKKKDIYNNFETLEDIWDEYNVYEKNE